MSFDQYIYLEIAKIVIVLIVARVVDYLLQKRRASFVGHLEHLQRKFKEVQPTDRLPSKREKRKMKWIKREMSGAEDELKRLKRYDRLILATYIICACWVMGMLVVDQITEPRHSRETETTTTGEVAMDEAGMATTDGGTSERSGDEASGLVGAILYDTEDAYYYKHLAELEMYTDDFGLDLDRLLNDYGYEFYACEADGFIVTTLPAEDGAYWMIFLNDERQCAISIHSFGGWIMCASAEQEYAMVPLTFEEPHEMVSLRERTMLMSRDALALLMEFLATQPKPLRLPAGTTRI